ncbi:MAG: RNA 2'-phosphotransferase [Planctomycetaceae bacterium]
MERRLGQVSKFLSLVLRHRPEILGMQLDPEGWLEIDRLIAQARQAGRDLDLATLHQVVADNDKQRFALSEDGLRIRANQGHSIAAIDLKLEPVPPPDQLFHGTIPDFLASIRRQGLRKRSRNHVHLSSDRETAQLVGARRGRPVILTIRAAEMQARGRLFFRSANGVWLTESVPVEFIHFPH